MEYREKLAMREMLVTGSVPVLACRTCKGVSVPAYTKRVTRAGRARGQKELTLRPTGCDLGLCRNAKFRYRAEDCEVIPGLEGGPGEDRSHYVPVFFSDDVLLRYRRQAEYAIESVRLHKRIVFRDGTRLSYGINRHGRVFCWLGDLDRIPQEEQMYLKQHNVESDHDVISSMYKEGRLGLDLQGVAEERLKAAVYELAEVSRARVGFAVHRLEYDDRRIAERLVRPKSWHRDITQALVDLERLCVEAIDAGSLKGSLHRPGDETKGLKGLNIMKAWIKLKLHVNEELTMMPFFVLNDWRNYRVHRDGDGSLLKALRGARAHLGMGEDDDDDERMYDLLLEALTRSCLELVTEVESTLSGDSPRRVPGSPATDRARRTGAT